MREPCAIRRCCRNGHRSRTAWEVAGFLAGLLLALLSAPFFWI
ncbi:hypothetical protein [uncultured Azohydromonas sp.]|jgi:hypothetical protein|nr:hypothetical protein [uncultured Azohydromonas sp.]